MDLIKNAPNLGLGLGLRNTHFQHIVDHWPTVNWFEAISENFMDSGGRPRYVLQQIAERYPIVLHGVSLSIGSTDALNFDYLKKLDTLAKEVNAKWVSDHLCWTGIHAVNSHDLLPVPLTEESLKHIAQRVNQVQDFLGRQIVLENPSTYLQFKQSTMTEPDFLRALGDLTGCGLLLDVNNVYVSSFNANTDPVQYLEAFPWQRVVQMHLAGHTHCGTHIIDTHDKAVSKPVWELFRLAWQKTGGVATLLEWDGDIPSFDECLAELTKAEGYMEGEFQGLKDDTTAITKTEHLSTPIDFLVSDVMQSTKASEPA